MKFTKELIVSCLIIIISLGVYVYLFGYADRKVVFLYEHLGLKPFDRMTSGRYWMAGLVLSGFLTVLYLMIQMVIVFILNNKKIYFKTVLKFSFLPLIIGILMITMMIGEPKMPFSIALSSAMALITGITIGFSVIDDFTSDTKSTLIYLFAGLGLVPFLTLFRALELPEMGILTIGISVLTAGFSLVFGIVWLMIFYRLISNQRPKMFNVFKGTLAITYLGLPVLHYLIATPIGIPYISSSENFFADNLILRFVNWILLILIVLSADKLSRRITHGGTSVI